MEAQEFQDLVLSLFNIERTVGDGTVESKLVERFKPLAYRECCMFADWSFLVKTKVYEAGDHVDCRGYDGHMYGFRLPQDFMKARLIDGRYNASFSIKGWCIYVDEPTLRLDYWSFDTTNAPKEFDQLAAYRCAIDMSQMLDPQGKALQAAQSLHQITLTTLSNMDSWSKRTRNPEFDIEDTMFRVPGNP